VLPLELLPGPASMLVFEGPGELQVGSRGRLGQLSAMACDDWGNVVEDISTEVGGRPGAEQRLGKGSGSAGVCAWLAGCERLQRTGPCASIREPAVPACLPA
jgi:hypothetical protein